MTVKRSEFAIYLNIVPGGTADYALIGDGVTDASINYNPQTLEETYIHQDSGTTQVESYRPTLPIEASCKDGDDVWDFIDGLRQSRAVLDAAETDILLVYLYETPTAGAYPCERQDVSVQIDSFGGPGGESNKISYTLNFIGDPETGTFDPVTGTLVTPSSSPSASASPSA